MYVRYGWVRSNYSVRVVLEMQTVGRGRVAAVPQPWLSASVSSDRPSRKRFDWSVTDDRHGGGPVNGIPPVIPLFGSGSRHIGNTRRQGHRITFCLVHFARFQRRPQISTASKADGRETETDREIPFSFRVPSTNTMQRFTANPPHTSTPTPRRTES